MSKYITILASALVFQFIIIVFLFSSDPKIDIENKARSLINLDLNELSTIKIVEGEKKLLLTKKQNKWQLEDYPALKLQSSKVKLLTNDLGLMKVTWPVTSTSSSHERFKVMNKNFEKLVVFTDNNGNKQTLIFGKSPSFKKLYVRNSDQNDVYSIEYSAYQISVDENDWLDKSMLSIDNVDRISHSDINLERNEDSWQLIPPSSLAKQQTIDKEKIEGFVNQLTNLSVSELAKDIVKPDTRITVFDHNNKQYTYSFASIEDNYYVQRNDIEQWFKLPKSTFKKFDDITLEKFISQPETQKEEESVNISE